MIENLHIEYFKNIRSLHLKDVARVNLITGKNNTGKSTLLEAISIYASKGGFSGFIENSSE